MLVALLLLFMAFPALALPTTTPRPDDPVPVPSLTAQAVTADIKIDGRFDEDDWHTASVATGFVQFEPVEGAAPSQETQVQVLYGADALFIGAHLFDDKPKLIQRTLGRRDAPNQADWFTVYIDSYFDRKTAYAFSVNAGGVQLDGIQTDDFDASWDAVWEAAVDVSAEGWAVEMRIPYAMLRFTETPVQQWGINFQREIPRTGEILEWVLVPRTERRGGVVAKYGILQGLQNLKPRRNLQVMPYTVSSVLSEEGDPGQRLNHTSTDVGGDVKIGLSSNLTLDMTLNPDFGQVESDPAELNLSAFETFFSERRPFFVEGAQIFDFDFGRDGSLLYTRRIGGRAPIIGASKLSGRTEHGLSMGLLGAATGHEFNPDYYYGVGRVRQDIGRYSSVGGMLTAYSRREDETPFQSFTGGVDFDFRSQSNRYRLSGYTAATQRGESNTAERPDRGFATSIEAEKIKGIWTYSLGMDLFDDGFNTNDLGRMRRNNFVRINGGFGHQVKGGEAFGPFRRASIRVFSWQLVSYDEGLNMGMGLFFSANAQFQGFQRLNTTFFADYLTGGYDLTETRGLGPLAQPREYSLRLSYDTDSRRAWQLEPGVRLFATDDGGRDLTSSLEGRILAGTRLSLSSEVSYTQSNNRRAWAANEAFRATPEGWQIGSRSDAPDVLLDDEWTSFAAPGVLDQAFAHATPFDESPSYFLPVLGRRDTRSLDVTLRSNVTFTPAFSLQWFAQMFVARGQYDDFEMLQDRDTLVPLPAFPKQYDFSLSSFQTNLVLRWEYRPGSALFVVWTQSRRDAFERDPFDLTTASPFEQKTFRQFGDTFELFPANVFLIKLNYMFMR